MSGALLRAPTMTAVKPLAITAGDPAGIGPEVVAKALEGLDVPARVFGGGEGAIGVRPEDIAIATEGVEAIVELVELTGAETWVHAAVGGESVIVRGPADFSAPPRSRVHLQFDARKLLRFD